MTEEEFETGLASVRSWRNEQLKDTDWTQLPDSTVDKAAWAAYRQVLRDLPSTYTLENLENNAFSMPVPPSN